MGELARKAGCPELPKSPLDLFTFRPSERLTTMEKLVWPFLGATISLYTVRKFVHYMRRPLWSGIHIHFISLLLGSYVFIQYRDSRLAAAAETAEVLKHYITLHPDDFPPYERKRWKDVYLPFNPIR